MQLGKMVIFKVVFEDLQEEIMSSQVRTIQIADEFVESETKTLDERNRVSLGKIAKGIKRVRLYRNKVGEIFIQPLAEIPASELWLYRNKKALASVKKGLRDATRRRVSKIKS